MLTPQFLLPISHELVIDLFAGGGGASTGIEQATGRHVDVAVNHDPQAVSLHEANHPQTRHFVSDVFEVDPLAVTDGRPVGLLWASPDCKHFSKAKGGKPRSRKIRALAWIVIKWIKRLRPTNTHPRIIFLENVEEFQSWGPLNPDGMPCEKRKGSTFQRWLAQLRNLGYAVEWRELRACDYGAPTIRKRLFLVARRDGEPIRWPTPTHGQGHSLPWRTAAECIDWSIPAPSIFERERPLAEATLRRIAHGIMRYVVNSPRPFIVPIAHRGDDRVHDSAEPLRTVTASSGGELALAVPTMVQTGYGERDGQAPRVPGLSKPLGTVVAGGSKHALVSAFLAKHYTGVVGSRLEEPIGTVTATDHHSLVTASTKGDHREEVRALLIKYYSTDQDHRLEEPMHTVTTKPRFGVVHVRGHEYFIADVGLRMLQPRELYRAQGFPDSYIIDRGSDGRILPKDAQVRMCGNSVCPPMARALVAANYVEMASTSSNDNTISSKAAA